MNKSNPENIYIDNITQQINKNTEAVCGDYSLIKRTSEYTIYILCDGIGSGIKARIAATMCASRIEALVNAKINLNDISKRIAGLMSRARKEDIPYSTFTIIKILNNGQFSVFCYENPMPLMLTGQQCLNLNTNYFTYETEIIGQSTGKLFQGDALIAFTDGISQAGLGRVPGFGWGNKNILEYLNHLLQKQLRFDKILESVLMTVKKLSGGVFVDDTTATLLIARKARILNLITGPPESKSNDRKMVKDFLESDGEKIICGSTTADIVSKYMNKKVEVLEISPSFAKPPQYSIEGIDIVSEGAVTLNQVYNLIEIDPDAYDESSSVSKIAKKLRASDQINIFWGLSSNTAHSDTSFIQMGILERKTILPLLIRKLERLDKTINVMKY
ncbi:MAG: SpoIIE family protein phosphatase [Clostridia bacterium]